MKWYIGQPIVAIRDSKCGNVKKNQPFTINGLRNSICKCKNHVQIDVGIFYKDNGSGIDMCVYCGFISNHDFIFWKSEKLFAPLDQDISELTEILEQPITKTLETK